MRNKACILVASLVLAACNNSQQEQKLKALNLQDSVLLVQAQKKDSTISSYIRTLNDIQDNIDSIKRKEKVLSIKAEGGSAGANTIADIKNLDKLILKNNKEIAMLEAKIKKMGKKDANMEKMVSHLTKELAERDSDIVVLQSKLSQTNTTMQALTQQFNDSMAILNVQRATNNSLVNDMHTVYYAIGTVKQLKQKGVIDKQGGIIGLGSTAKLKQNFNKKYFTRADMTQLSTIPLYSKFSKVITDQPNNAFKVEGNTKADSLLITNPDEFWSESKYLVVVVK